MQYYEISYYKTHSWIHKKYIASEMGSGYAILKSRIKKPVDVVEISYDDYIKYSGKKK